MISGISSGSEYRYGVAEEGAEGAASQAEESTFSDPISAWAALLIENDYQRAEQDRQELEAARRAQSTALDAQVDAMHEAADNVWTGAFVQGVISVGAGTLTTIASIRSLNEANELKKVADAKQAGGALASSPKVGEGGADLANARVAQKMGEGIGTLAEPAGKLVGEVPRMHADARAQQARNDAERASWAADDAAQHRERMEREADRGLDFVSGMIEGEEQADAAVLANY